MFSPARTLSALHAFDRELMLSNACARVAGACVWIDADARLAAREVERRFAIAVREGGPRSHASDSYVCMGAPTLGSGRSVFVEGYQVKGVGRTVHAPPRGNPLVTDGRFAVERALREVHGAAVVRSLSAIPQIPLAFAIAVDGGMLLGRRGSPIRIGHLDYLRGATYVHPLHTRIARWCRFVNRLVGRPGIALDLDDVHGVFDAIIDRALLAIAEARVYGLTFANWHDNADLFARAFDCEDVAFHAGTPLVPQGPSIAPRETPRSYFTRTLWASIANLRGDVFACSLQYLQNAYVALDHIAAGLTYDERALDARYNWKRLRTGYRAALAQVLGADAKRMARRVPLVGGDGTPFDASALLPGPLRARLAGLPAERAALVAADRADLRALFRRADRSVCSTKGRRA